MHAMGARKRFITAIALSALGTGCGPEQQQQRQEADEPKSVSRMQQRLVSDWIITGLQVGTAWDDEFLGVTLDERGNVFVVGYENGITGATNVEPTGDSRGLIIRYDPYLDDTQATQVTIDGIGTTEVIEAVTLHPVSQELYFAGRTTGALANIQNQGQFDNIAGWLDSNGTAHISQWGTQRPQHPRGIAIDSKGDVVVSGYDDLYIPSNYVEAVEDPFVTKLKQESVGGLTPLWTRQFGTGYSDLLPGMVLDDADTIYVTGSNASGTYRGMFARSFSASGADGWFQRQSTISYDSAAALALTGPQSSRSLIFAGSTFAQLGERQFGEQDVVVRNLSLASGTTFWTHQYGTQNSEWVTDMTTDAAGNIYLVGETTGTFSQQDPNQGQSDIFVMRLDPNGLNPEVIQLGSPGEEHPTAVATDACGNIYVTGYTTASLGGGTHHGGRDAFVMRIRPPNTYCITARP